MKFYAPSIDILDKIKRFPITECIEEKQKISFNNSIIFKDIDFSHQENKILNKISFTINKGGINCILGKSGVGKTTILDLMLGFLFPSSGSIIIDDCLIDIENYKKLRNICGYVSQNVSFTDSSIINNIVLGQTPDNIDTEKIMKILSCVELKDTVCNLSDNIYSNIGEAGIKLSGGQRQRLGIARALYRSPQLLILDEATNAVDLHTEENIISNIKKYFPEITIILITHRLSTLVHYDNIFILQDSRMLSFKQGEVDVDVVSELIK